MEVLNILAGTTNAAIIAVTEIWLDNTISDNEVCIPGYGIQRKDRNREEGVFVFLSAITLISIGDVTLIKMTLNFWL